MPVENPSRVQNLPIENTLNGKRPRLVHGPRAGLMQFRWIPSLKLLPKSLKFNSRERASGIAQKPTSKLAAAMPLGRLWARMLRMLSAGAQFPLILRLVAIAMTRTLTTDNCGCERLISPIMMMSDLQTGFHWLWQTRMARRTRPGGRLLAVLSNCGGPLKWIGRHTQNGNLQRPRRGWFAVGSRIEDINVTMRRRQQPPGQLLIQKFQAR